MPDYNEVQNSGKMESFTTGSVRDSREGKGRFDLLPVHGLIRLAKHYENGAKKYGDRNWEKGQPQGRYLDSAMRHLVKHLGGDRSEDHLAACAWNCFAMMEQEEKMERGLAPKELNDLPPTVFKENEFIEKPKEDVGIDITSLVSGSDYEKKIMEQLKKYFEKNPKEAFITGTTTALPNEVGGVSTKIEPLITDANTKKLTDDLIKRYEQRRLH